MRKNTFYIRDILSEVCSSLSHISENVTASERKDATQMQMNDFIVVSTVGKIPDSKAFQSSKLSIDIAARNIQNGLEDVMKLQDMLDSVMSLFPLKTKRFSITNPNIVLKGDDGLGFSHWLVNSDLKINATDSYKY